MSLWYFYHFVDLEIDLGLIPQAKKSAQNVKPKSRDWAFLSLVGVLHKEPSQQREIINGMTNSVAKISALLECVHPGWEGLKEILL